MHKFLSISLFFFCYTYGFSQYKPELPDTYKKKAPIIEHLVKVTFEQPDSTQALSYIGGFKKWAQKNKDSQMVLEAKLIKAYYYQKKYAHQHPNYFKYTLAVYQEAKIKNRLFVRIRAAKTIALYYWAEENYQEAFQWLMLCHRLLQKIKSPQDFPFMAETLNQIGRSYYFFADYDQAIVYFKKIIQLPITHFNSLLVIRARNMLGLCYQKLGKLEVSDYYFKTIVQDTSQYNNPTWKDIAQGNLGYNHYLRKDYGKAIPLLKENVHFALKTADSSLAAGAAIPLADIYYRQHNLKKCCKMIEIAEKCIKNSGSYDRLRKLYPIKSKYYTARHQTDSSAVYLDSAILAAKQYNQKYSSLKLMRAKQKVQFQRNKLKVQRLKSQSQADIVQRNWLIAIVILLFVTGSLIYITRNRSLRRKHELQKLSLKNAQEALKHSQTRLDNLTRKVKRDNRTIEQLQKVNNPKNKETIAQLKTGNILTKKDWIEFQRLFEKVYPGYLENLKTTYQNLTPAETRYFCLEKLHLSGKEMALALGVSKNSIMVTKHRIRKKLNLSNQKELEKIIRKL